MQQNVSVEISAEADDALTRIQRETGGSKDMLASTAVLAWAHTKDPRTGRPPHAGPLHDALSDIMNHGGADVRAMVEKYLFFFQAHATNSR